MLISHLGKASRCVVYAWCCSQWVFRKLQDSNLLLILSSISVILGMIHRGYDTCLASIGYTLAHHVHSVASLSQGMFRRTFSVLGRSHAYAPQRTAKTIHEGTGRVTAAMEVDIEGNPSQGEAPETKTKKNGKAKRVDAIVAPPNTLTRFLSLAGPPFSSAWEDVNRQCPVCQQNGFSSRGLALHVNSCLDTGAPKVNEQGEDQGTDTNDEGLQAEVARGRAGAAGGRARVAANGASAPSCHARYNCADATDRSGKHDQASPNASTSSAGGDGTREEAGKSGVRQGHTLKGMRPPTGEKKGSKVRHAFSRVGKPGELWEAVRFIRGRLNVRTNHPLARLSSTLLVQLYLCSLRLSKAVFQCVVLRASCICVALVTTRCFEHSWKTR